MERSCVRRINIGGKKIYCLSYAEKTRVIQAMKMKREDEVIERRIEKNS